MKMPIPSHCPTCGGTHLAEKTVEKILRGGNHTATITVEAVSCQDCGERIYSSDVLKRFDEVRARLERGETSGYKPIGQAFQVA